jgi:hypothetical protein
VPPRKQGAAAQDAKGGAGTFDAMYSGGGKGGATAWARPRPELHAVGAEEDERELAPVLPRVLDAVAVEKLYDALDYVAPTLKPNDQAVYIRMVRRSYGAGRETCLVNLPLFSELTGLSITGLQYVLRRLKTRNLIAPVEKRGGRQEQGVEYTVKVPKK